ncbi:MAG: GntR family transcriptional regulator [Comamonadaceae bacterium]|nr:MAG: GntR family transcriptional regulator [Comamonadaceae bacterium]
MTKLMNLDSRTLVTRIADNLREQIIMGQLESGARIRQDEFAVAFGVSRTPLRDRRGPGHPGYEASTRTAGHPSGCNASHRSGCREVAQSV